MNAQGISVFYGAKDPSVALAEVRPPVGSKVAVARFEIILPLNLLDLTSLARIHPEGSVFDVNFIHLLERWAFLGVLCELIAKPVMPDDEAFEYVVTQAVADFLSTDDNLKLDGVIFPSVQMSGRGANIVLFHKSSKVEEMDLPVGTEISCYCKQDEDGNDMLYAVDEMMTFNKKSRKNQEKESLSDLLDTALGLDASELNCLKPALRIDKDNILVHNIESVNFPSRTIEVKRSRYKKRKGEFRYGSKFSDII